jgi:hypothetical protein
METVLTHPKALSEVIRVVGFFLLSGKFFSGGANHEGLVAIRTRFFSFVCTVKQIIDQK